MSQNLTISNITKSIPILLATAGITVGLRSFTSPNAVAETFGLPQSPSSTVNNHFIPVFGGRNVAGGLTIYAFAYQRNWNAVGTVMLCGLVTGLTDAVVCSRHGIRGTAIGHLVTCVLTGGLGFWLCFGA